MFVVVVVSLEKCNGISLKLIINEEEITMQGTKGFLSSSDLENNATTTTTTTKTATEPIRR